MLSVCKRVFSCLKNKIILITPPLYFYICYLLSPLKDCVLSKQKAGLMACKSFAFYFLFFCFPAFSFHGEKPFSSPSGASSYSAEHTLNSIHENYHPPLQSLEPKPGVHFPLEPFHFDSDLLEQHPELAGSFLPGTLEDTRGFHGNELKEEFLKANVLWNAEEEPSFLATRGRDALERVVSGIESMNESSCPTCTEMRSHDEQMFYPKKQGCPKVLIKQSLLKDDIKAANLLSPDRTCGVLPSDRVFNHTRSLEAYFQTHPAFKDLLPPDHPRQLVSECVTRRVKTSRRGSGKVLPSYKHKTVVAHYYSTRYRLTKGIEESLDQVATIDSLLGEPLLKNQSCGGASSPRIHAYCKQLKQKGRQCRNTESLERAAQDTLVAMEGLREIEKTSQRMLRQRRGGSKEYKELQVRKETIENMYPWLRGKIFKDGYKKGMSVDDGKKLLRKQLRATRSKVLKRRGRYEKALHCVGGQSRECRGFLEVLSKAPALNVKEVMGTGGRGSNDSNGNNNRARQDVIAGSYLQAAGCREEQRRKVSQAKREDRQFTADVGLVLVTAGLGTAAVLGKMSFQLGRSATQVQRLRNLGFIGLEVGVSVPFMREAIKECGESLNQLESLPDLGMGGVAAVTATTGRRKGNKIENICEGIKARVSHTSDVRSCMVGMAFASMPVTIPALGMLGRKMFLAMKSRRSVPQSVPEAGASQVPVTARGVVPSRALPSKVPSPEAKTRPSVCWAAVGCFARLDDRMPQAVKDSPQWKEGLRRRKLIEEHLGRSVDMDEALAIERAHLVGAGELGADGKTVARIGNYTMEQKVRKGLILRRAGFTREETKILMDQGDVGNFMDFMAWSSAADASSRASAAADAASAANRKMGEMSRQMDEMQQNMLMPQKRKEELVDALLEQRTFAQEIEGNYQKAKDFIEQFEKDEKTNPLLAVFRRAEFSDYKETIEKEMKAAVERLEKAMEKARFVSQNTDNLSISDKTAQSGRAELAEAQKMMEEANKELKDVIARAQSVQKVQKPVPEELGKQTEQNFSNTLNEMRRDGMDLYLAATDSTFNLRGITAQAGKLKKTIREGRKEYSDLLDRMEKGSLSEQQAIQEITEVSKKISESKNALKDLTLELEQPLDSAKKALFQKGEAAGDGYSDLGFFDSTVKMVNTIEQNYPKLRRALNKGDLSYDNFLKQAREHKEKIEEGREKILAVLDQAKNKSIDKQEAVRQIKELYKEIFNSGQSDLRNVTLAFRGFIDEAAEKAGVENIYHIPESGRVARRNNDSGSGSGSVAAMFRLGTLGVMADGVLYLHNGESYVVDPLLSYNEPNPGEDKSEPKEGSGSQSGQGKDQARRSTKEPDWEAIGKSIRGEKEPDSGSQTPPEQAEAKTRRSQTTPRSGNSQQATKKGNVFSGGKQVGANPQSPWKQSWSRMEDRFRAGKVPDRQVRMAIQMGIRSSSSERRNWTVEKAVGLGKRDDVQRVLELSIKKNLRKPHSQAVLSQAGQWVKQGRLSRPWFTEMVSDMAERGQLSQAQKEHALRQSR